MSAANYFGLATPPQARDRVMVMAMVLAEQCHDAFKLMTWGRKCQAGHVAEFSVPRCGLPPNLRLVNILLQRPIAGSIAIWIGIYVVGLYPLALLVHPGVAVGAGILGNFSGIRVEALLLIE
jgi:hypothetical protein